MSLSSVCVVVNALRLRKFKTNFKLEENNKEELIKMKKVLIDGMSCSHCSSAVEKALSSINGVKKVTVSLENKEAIIDIDLDIKNEEIEKVVESAGYKVVKID